MEKMFEYLQPLQIKDPRRIYGQLEREIIYFESNKKCAVCDVTVPWDEVEIHHLEQHSHGGSTKIENGALVHRACHPKSLSATQALSAKIKRQKSAIREALDLL
jgi:HNH endonuclease